jgi:hypothetical protein
MNFFKSILLSLVLANAIYAVQTIAVLEIIPKTEVDITISEMQLISDELRRQAMLTLPRDKFSILTRENFMLLLKDAGPIHEGNVIELGRALKADIVSKGNVFIFDGELTVHVELYDSRSGNMLSSMTVKSRNVQELLEAVTKHAPPMFAALYKPEPIAEILPPPCPEIPAPVPCPECKQQPESKKIPTWVAVGSHILGIAFLSYGFFQYYQSNSHYKDYATLLAEEHTKSKKDQYDDKLDRANNEGFRGNIGVGIGSVFMAISLGLHINF